MLSLENLGRITEVLRQGGQGSGQGLRYRDYLRILLNLGSLGSQKMRALDMIQAELREEEESRTFLANNCVVALKSRTSWNCRPVFAGLPRAVFGGRQKGIRMEQEGSIAY